MELISSNFGILINRSIRERWSKSADLRLLGSFQEKLENQRYGLNTFLGRKLSLPYLDVHNWFRLKISFKVD